MENTVDSIVDELEQLIQNAMASGDKYDFIDPAYDVVHKLERLPDNFAAVAALLELIERSPDIDYGGPGPLGVFLEAYYGKGYEALLAASIDKKPTAYTLYLLDRCINDRKNPHRNQYIELLKNASSRKDLSTDTREYANFAQEKLKKMY